MTATSEVKALSGINRVNSFINLVGDGVNGVT